MSEEVKTKLAEAIKKYGTSIAENASKNKSILNNLLKN